MVEMNTRSAVTAKIGVINGGMIGRSARDWRRPIADSSISFGTVQEPR